jgi:hypothetical protein
MRFARPLLSFVLATSLLIPTAAPQTATSPLAVQYLQKALAALSGSTPVSDVTLTGTAQRIAGSDDETGAATLKAIVGASRIDLNFSSGPRSEIQNVVVGAPVGSWSGPDGASHPMTFHNLLTDPAWFFPAFPITHGLSGSARVISYVGHETRHGQAVEHLTVAQSLAMQTPSGTPTMAHLSQMDFFLDSATFLPAAVTFNIHPDNNAGLDIPTEVRFSDYRAVNGVQVPFHVQKLLNNGLILDLHLNTATLNTGLTASQFQVGE